MGKPTTNTDLADLLGQATETASSPGAADFAPIEVQPAAPTPDDVPTAEFGPEPDPVGEPETFEEEPVKVVNPEDARKSARRIINFIDNLQKPFLTSVYKKTVLFEGDYEKVQQFHEEKAKRGTYSFQDAITEDNDFYDVSKRFEEYMDLVKAAPFTEDEKDSLTGPLAEVLEKHSQFQLSPEMALLLAVAMVMLPRVAPLIPQFRKGFNV